MILKHYRDAEAIAMTDEGGVKRDTGLTFIGGAHGVTKRVILGQKEGAQNFIMRVIDFEKNAQSPYHKHPWEHEAFVIKGSGFAYVNGQQYTIQEGNVFFIAPDEEHCFTTKDTPMEILCLIPKNDEGVE
jgi:quercetin dioxygenase-like cupin family protein